MPASTSPPMRWGVVGALAVLVLQLLALSNTADATSRWKPDALLNPSPLVGKPGDEIYNQDSPAHVALRCPASCAPDVCGGVAGSSFVDGIISARAYDTVVSRGDKLCVKHCRKPTTCKRPSSSLDNDEHTAYCDELDCVGEDIVGCSHDLAFFQPTCASCVQLFPRACAPALSSAVDAADVVAPHRRRHLLQPGQRIQTARQLSDAALAQPIDSAADTDPSDMTRWWRKNYESSDGACGVKCEEEKIRLCAIHPQTCIELRCEDLREDRGFTEYGTLCDALSKMEEPVQLGLGAEEMLFRWRLYHSRLPRVCDEACELHKIHMCHLYPHLCQALRCEDAALGHGNTDVLRVCGNKSVDAALVASKNNNTTNLPREIQGTMEMWRLHSTLGDRRCGGSCEKFKTQTCESDPVLCMELSCENAWTLLDDTSILDVCDAYYPAPGPRLAPGAMAVSEADLREKWAQLAVITPDCNAACTAVKMELCPQHPVTCLLLTCSDAASGGGHAVPGMAPICDRMALPQLEAMPPSAITTRSADEYAAATVVAVASDWYRKVSALGGECDEECSAFKLRTCVEHDYLCLRLTCDDAARRGETTMSELCELVLPQLNVPEVPADLYERVIGGLDNNVRREEDAEVDKPAPKHGNVSVASNVGDVKFASEEDAEIAREWSELVSQQTECGPRCQSHKLATCIRRPNLCIQLTCEDALSRQQATPIAQLCGRIQRPGVGGHDAEHAPSMPPVPAKQVEADAAAVVQRARSEDMSLITLASTVDDNEFRRIWNGLSKADGACDRGCEDGKLAMCITRIPMCVVMRCEDMRAEVGEHHRFRDDDVPHLLGMCSAVTGRRKVEGDSLRVEDLVDHDSGALDLRLAKLPEFLFPAVVYRPPVSPAKVDDEKTSATTTTTTTTTTLVALAGPALDAFRKQWPTGPACMADCPWEKARLCRSELDFCAVLRCEDALAGRARFAGDGAVASACETMIMQAEAPIAATVDALGAEKAVAFLFGVPYSSQKKAQHP